MVVEYFEYQSSMFTSLIIPLKPYRKTCFFPPFTEVIEFENFLLLQPLHTKEIIPNMNHRIKFDSVFFANIEMEKQSQISEQQDSPGNEIEIDENIESEKCWLIEVTQEEADKVPPNDEAVPDNEIRNEPNISMIQHKDLFGVTEICDLDYEIIVGKYQASNILDAGDRISLSHCIMKHIFKSDIKRE